MSELGFILIRVRNSATENMQINIVLGRTCNTNLICLHKLLVKFKNKIK